MKKRVTGIGGLFFKTEDPKATKNQYKNHLGFNTDDWGCTFWWKDENGNKCSTQWSPFTKDSTYFEPSKKDFMFNYRVENLVELLKVLKKKVLPLWVKLKNTITENLVGQQIQMEIKLNFGSQKMLLFCSFSLLKQFIINCKIFNNGNN